LDEHFSKILAKSSVEDLANQGTRHLHEAGVEVDEGIKVDSPNHLPLTIPKSPLKGKRVSGSNKNCGEQKSGQKGNL